MDTICPMHPFSSRAWLAIFGLVILLASPVWAQEGSDGGGRGRFADDVRDEPEYVNPYADALTLDGFIRRTGIMAYPLIALSMLAVFLLVLFSFTIRQGTIVSDSFMNQADALIRKQDYAGLLLICNRRNEAIARITAKTLDFATRNPTASFDEVKEVTEAEGNRQSSLLMSRTAYLGDVGAVAPMLGLLGTTLGMITTFHEISGKDFGGSNQLGLAQGVSEALLCTASGLVIGIPALIGYAVFRGKANRLISEMEAATTHLMALLAVQYKRAARATSRQGVVSLGDG